MSVHSVYNVFVMEKMNQKRILIYGSGAIGCYFGGKLVQNGFDVTFVARKNLEDLKQNGLTIKENNTLANFPINVVSNTQDLGTFDYIFMCVKSKDTKSATKQILENIAENTSVVSFQNGVDNEEIIGSVIGIDKVIGASLYIAAKVTGLATVETTGIVYIEVGELNRTRTDRILELQNILRTSGIDCNISLDIWAELWHKLIRNASINPISTLSRKTVGEILDDKESCELLKNTMLEVKHVAFLNGINIDDEIVDFHLQNLQGYRSFKTSMLQDFEAGRPLELDELVGVVIRKAKEKNISVPNLEMIYNQIKEKTSVSVK